jgi:hypothetical protein
MNSLLSTLAPAFTIAAAAIGWLTAFAVLKEARPNRMMLVLPYEGARTAWRQLLATGQHVDRVALSAAFRPLLHLGVVLLIFGSSTAYLLTMPSRPPPSLWGSLLLLSLSLRFAMLAPCPWVRFVFVGERRDDCPTTYTGPERRRHVTE